MTNLEIIVSEMVLHNVPLDLEVDTYAGWHRKGFQINKGEHAVFSTKIWKPVKRKAETEDGEDETKLVLVRASFFTKNQVVSLQEV